MTGRGELKRPRDATSSSPRRRANNERRVLIIQKSPRRLLSTLHVCKVAAATVVGMTLCRSKVNDSSVHAGVLPSGGTHKYACVYTHTGDLNASHGDSRVANY